MFIKLLENDIIVQLNLKTVYKVSYLPQYNNVQ